MFTIAKTFRFSAAHCLDHLPETHPCARLHGHNYEVTLVCRSAYLTADNMVLDFRELDTFRAIVDARYDHRHLNDVCRGGLNTTSEALAEQFYWIARSECGLHLVHAVRVAETPATIAEFSPYGEL